MDERERAQRAAAISEAYTWIGTPFASGARIKGGGTDCAMLIEQIFIAAGVIDQTYPGKYSSQWHLHRDEERYLAWANHLAVEVPRPQPGDVGIWQLGRCFAHAGLFVDDLHIIHAWEESGKVLRSPVRFGRLSMRPGARGPEPRPVKYFDVWAKTRHG